MTTVVPPAGAAPERLAAWAAVSIAVVRGEGEPDRAEDARRAVAGPEGYALWLARVTGGELVSGAAFGTAWPLVRVGAGLLGPGVPVLVADRPREGPDGAYRGGEAGVEREGPAGTELLWSPAGPRGRGGPQLLLFEPAARWLLDGGRVVVEDPFCRGEAAPGAERIQALLERRLGIDPRRARRLAREARPGVGAVTVWREERLVGEAWRDPQRVVGAREGVSARREGETVVLATARGEAVFELERPAQGWSARLVRGFFPAERVAVAPERGRIAYRWELAPGFDPLDDGVRARLAFDLSSDLVVLGSPTE